MKILTLPMVGLWLVGSAFVSAQEKSPSNLTLDETLDLMGIKISKLTCPPIEDGSKKWKFTIEHWKGNKMLKLISTTDGDYVNNSNILIKFPTKESPFWKVASDSTNEESSEPVILSENGAVAWHFSEEKSIKKGKQILALRTDGITDPVKGNIEEKWKQISTLNSEYSQYMVFAMEVY